MRDFRQDFRTRIVGSPTSLCQQWNFVITNTQRVVLARRFPQQLNKSRVTWTEYHIFRFMIIWAIVFFSQQINHFFFTALRVRIVYIFDAGWSRGNDCPRKNGNVWQRSIIIAWTENSQLVRQKIPWFLSRKIEKGSFVLGWHRVCFLSLSDNGGEWLRE